MKVVLLAAAKTGPLALQLIVLCARSPGAVGSLEKVCLRPPVMIWMMHRNQYAQSQSGIKKGKPHAWSTQSGNESIIVGRTSKGSCRSTGSGGCSRSCSSVDCASVACQNGLKIQALRVCLGEGVVEVEVEVVVLIVVLVQIEVVVVVVGKHFFVTCRHHKGSHEFGAIFMYPCCSCAATGQDTR